MKNLELNKILGAILFVAFIVAFTSNIMDTIYTMQIGHIDHNNEIVEPNALSESGASDNNSSNNGSNQTNNFDIPTLMKTADSTKGSSIAKKCTSCHSFDKGGPNKVGPNLYGILGTKIATVDNFKYSEAITKHGGQWDYESMFKWINSPKKFIPGNKMSYAGISKSEDIANLIAYMQAMHDNPPSPPVTSSESLR